MKIKILFIIKIGTNEGNLFNIDKKFYLYIIQIIFNIFDKQIISIKFGIIKYDKDNIIFILQNKG